MGLHVGRGHPASDAVAKADLVPNGRWCVLAQDVVADGGAAGDAADPGMVTTGTGAHVEVVGGAGLEAQLRTGVPGHREAGKVAVRLNPCCGHPALDPGTEADLVPGGRGRVLAQDVVAGGGAHLDLADLGVGVGGSGAHVEVERVGALDAQLRVGTPGHPQAREVAAGLHMFPVYPAVHAVAVADPVPDGRGRVLAQDDVLLSGSALDEADLGVGPAGAGAHVEAERGGGLENQPRGGVPGHGQAREATVGLDPVRGHPAVDSVAEADFVPARPWPHPCPGYCSGRWNQL